MAKFNLYKPRSSRVPEGALLVIRDKQVPVLVPALRMLLKEVRAGGMRQKYPSREQRVFRGLEVTDLCFSWGLLLLRTCDRREKLKSKYDPSTSSLEQVTPEPALKWQRNTSVGGFKKSRENVCYEKSMHGSQNVLQSILILFSCKDWHAPVLSQL